MKWHIQLFKQLESTQTYLKTHVNSLPEGTVIVAQQQTQGYGRKGDFWFSAPGGLYFSFSLKPQTPLPLLPIILLHSIYACIEKESGLSLALKWPNDILYEQHKLCGILVDGQIMGNHPQYYICGIGINVNQPQFPPNLSATSLRMITTQTYNIKQLLDTCLQEFQVNYELALQSEYLYRLRYNNHMAGKNILLDATGRQFKRAEELLEI